MLRKLLILIFIAGTTNAIAQDNNAAQSKTTEKKSDLATDYKQLGAPMPSLLMLPFYDSANTAKDRKKLINNNDLNNGANLFVMMFNPTCGHCQDEALQLEKNIDLFKRSKLVLLANKTMRTYLNDFVTLVHLDDYPSIYLGIDSTGDFINNVFMYQALPQINIYNSDRKLIRNYNGEVAVDSLKKYIQ